jgi:predicted transcriptional regulator
VGDSVASFVVDCTRFTIVAEPLAPETSLGIVARAMYNERRVRDHVAELALFGEPAWDILLDLFASEAEGKSVSISSACLAASVPMTTALRWVSRLEEEGLIERRATGDRRRINVLLTAAGREKVSRTVVAMAAAQKARPNCHREGPNGR